MMREKKLVPYSVYLPVEYYNKIRKLAKERKASSTVRDAIMMAIDGGDTFASGYNQGLRDSVRVIDANKEIDMISIKGKNLGDLLADQILRLKK